MSTLLTVAPGQPRMANALGASVVCCVAGSAKRPPGQWGGGGNGLLGVGPGGEAQAPGDPVSTGTTTGRSGNTRRRKEGMASSQARDGHGRCLAALGSGDNNLARGEEGLCPVVPECIRHK